MWRLFAICAIYECIHPIMRPQSEPTQPKRRSKRLEKARRKTLPPQKPPSEWDLWMAQIETSSASAGRETGEVAKEPSATQPSSSTTPPVRQRRAKPMKEESKIVEKRAAGVKKRDRKAKAKSPSCEEVVEGEESSERVPWSDDETGEDEENEAHMSEWDIWQADPTCPITTVHHLILHYPSRSVTSLSHRPR